MIQISNVTKSYQDKKVVNNVSLMIPKGKLTSFIGPNGAGKSTLLSIMSRLMPSEEGEVLIEGKKLEEWKPNQLAKKMAVLRQNNHLNLRLTIRQLVSFGRFPHSGGRMKEEDEEKVDEAISYMQLQDIEHKYLDELSGGQRQRAYIAMVLAQNSDYILLDEPLNNLDMKHSVEIMKILQKLTRELGKTVIIVIHDINFASCYSDYIVALKEGIIEKEGTSEELIEEKVLSTIYEIPFKVQQIEKQKVCIYY